MGVIAVGLLSHGTGADGIPDFADVGRLLTAVNAQSPPSPTPWLGFGANHNRLIDAAADCEWYVALNADVTVSGRQIQQMVEEADRWGFSLVAPLRREPWGGDGGLTEALPAPGRLLRGAVVPDRVARRLRKRTRSSGPFIETPWVSGSCMAIRRDVLESVRFDERYFMYFEDVDLSCRARSIGARVGVCTSVMVDHAVGWQPGDQLLSERGVEYARSAFIYAETYGYSRRLMRFAALAHAGVRSVPSLRHPAAVAANRSLFKAFAGPGRPGLREIAAVHNERFGLTERPAMSESAGESSA